MLDMTAKTQRAAIVLGVMLAGGSSVISGCGTSSGPTQPIAAAWVTPGQDGAGGASSSGGQDATAGTSGGIDGARTAGGDTATTSSSSSGAGTDGGATTGTDATAVNDTVVDPVDGGVDPVDAGAQTGQDSTIALDTSVGSSSGGDDAAVPDGVITEWDIGEQADLGSTTYDTGQTVADANWGGTSSGGGFGGDISWGSSEDSFTVKPDIDYSELGDTGTTGTIPGLCTPKMAQYNIEDKKTGGKVDVIWWIDTSGSMSQEAKWLNSNLDAFAAFLAQGGLDYRMVLVGTGLGLNPQLGKYLAPGTFLWVKKAIYSTDGLKKISPKGSNYLNDFINFLRPDATKNWVAVTDDNSTQYKGSQFDQDIMAVSVPGNPAVKLFQGYVWHSIVAYGPLASKGCSTGARIGTEYLWLTQKTNGVKGKVCDQDWKPIFADIAKGVIQSAKPGCEYPIEFYKDETTTKGFDLIYIAQDDELTIKHATGNVCPADGNGFEYDKWPNPKKIKLCSSSCQKLKGGGNLVFNHGCL